MPNKDDPICCICQDYALPDYNGSHSTFIITKFGDFCWRHLNKCKYCDNAFCEKCYSYNKCPQCYHLCICRQKQVPKDGLWVCSEKCNDILFKQVQMAIFEDVDTLSLSFQLTQYIVQFIEINVIPAIEFEIIMGNSFGII